MKKIVAKIKEFFASLKAKIQSLFKKK